MMRIARHWFELNFLLVVLGLSIAIFFDHILDFSDNFFRVMLTFFCMTFTVIGLIGMTVYVIDTHRTNRKSSKYISRSK